MNMPNPMNYDSDVDYYEALEDYQARSNRRPHIEDDNDFKPVDDDCQYWESNCYGRG